MKEIHEQQLKAVVASIFSVEPSQITPELRPGDIPQWDSLGHVSLVSGLEQEFTIHLTMEEALAINSVKDIQDILSKHGIRIIG